MKQATKTATQPNGQEGGTLATPWRLVPLEQITACPLNPRKSFAKDKLAELAQSIKAAGVLEPVVLRRVVMSDADARKAGREKAQDASGTTYYGDRFELVAGERRYRAAQLAGLEAIPATIHYLSDRQVLELMVIENEQREDLTALEKAEGYAQLVEKHQVPIEDLAGKIGKSVSTIRDLLRLRLLPLPARQAVQAGTLHPSTAGLIARIPSPAMRTKAAEVILCPEEEKLEELLAGLPGHQDRYGLIDDIAHGEEPLSYRHARELISTCFTRELKQAPWSQKDLTLVPSAGACTTCPKRSGNNREDYPDGRADLCNDTACFAQKLAAHQQRVREQHEAAGKKVVTGKEAEKLFSRYNGDRLNINTPYRGIEESEWIGGKNQPLRKLVGKELAGEAVLIEAPSGSLIQAYPAKRVEEVLEEKHPRPASDGNGWQRSQRKREAKERAKQKLAAEVGRRCRDLVVPAAEAKFAAGCTPTGKELLRLLVAGHAEECWTNIQTAVLHARGEKSGHYDQKQTSLKKLIDSLDWKQLFGFWAEMVLARRLQDAAGSYAGAELKKRRNAFLQAFGVDWAKLEQEVVREQAGKGKKQAKASANGKGRKKAESAAAVLQQEAEQETDPVVRKRLQGMVGDLNGEPRGQCRVCQCSEHDCSGCVERTGEACRWTSPAKDLCSACLPLLETELTEITGRAGALSRAAEKRLATAGIRCVGHVHGHEDAATKLTNTGLRTDQALRLVEAVKSWVQEQLGAGHDSQIAADMADPDASAPISREMFLVDLLSGKDVSAAGRKLEQAGLHTVGDLLGTAAGQAGDDLAEKVQFVLERALGTKHARAGREIMSALLDAELVGDLMTAGGE